MAITNLTGTTWTINRTATYTSSINNYYNIKCKWTFAGSSSTTKSPYDYINIYHPSASSTRTITIGCALYGDVQTTTLSTPTACGYANLYSYYSFNEYQWIKYYGSISSGKFIKVTTSDVITIQIIGGNDVTNTTLINWLQANATQVETGYSITYHANGGTPTPQNLTDQTELPTLPIVSKSNYNFVGWYYDSIFTQEAHTGDTLSANVDLYAKFVLSVITLDLSTIGFPAGTHSIQMKLSDDGLTKRDSELSNSVTYTRYQKLTAPVISLSGDILTWSAVPNASSYKLYADDTGKGTVTSGVNLMTMQLATGSHSIQVMAVGSGYYTDSDKSNAVSYTVLPQLNTPANLTASGTTISFDAVDNAEEYEVLADGASIGGYTPEPSGYTLTVDNMGYCGFIDNPTIIKINDGEEYQFPYDLSQYPITFEHVVKVKCLASYDYNHGLEILTPERYDIQPNHEYVLIGDATAQVRNNTCLASNTLVLTDNGYKEIKDINVNTPLLTYSEETRQNEYKKVVKWWHHPSSDLVIINDNLFTMTGDHPIYINDYEIVKGREVKVGDFLIDKDGNKVLVEKVEFSNEEIEVYMVEVEDNHNFYITDKNLLSHNY